MSGVQKSTKSEAVSEPGIDSFAVLVRTDPASLSAGEQVDLLVEFERHAAWFESLRLDALAAFAGPASEGDVERPTNLSTFNEPADFDKLFSVDDEIRDEVAAALRISGRSADRRIGVARGLAFTLPRTRRLLRTGRCSFVQALMVVDECDGLSPAQVREVEALALNDTANQTLASTKRCVRRAVAAIAPPTLAELVDDEFAAVK